MPTWLYLAWIEWFRSFTIHRTGGGQGKRDFFWLSALLSLTILLALLLLGTKQGVLRRFMDVSLGYLPNYGVPIWLVANTDGYTNVGVTKQHKQIVTQAFPEITLYPYREVLPSELKLPSTNTQTVWKIKSHEREFTGWVVDPIDPLWQGLQGQASTTPSLQLTIVASEQAFAEHFQCDAYRALLAGKPGITLPPPTAQPTTPQADCLANGILWLQARPGTRLPTFLPFHIIWQPRILTMGTVAYLLPRVVYQALRLAKNSTNLLYYPQAADQDPPITWIKSLLLWDDTNPVAPSVIQNIAACLDWQWHPNRKQMSFKSLDNHKGAVPLPKVQACLTNTGIALESPQKTSPATEPYFAIGEQIAGDRLYVDSQGILNAPCNALDMRLRQYLACTAHDSALSPLNMEKLMSGDEFAIAYVRDPTLLFSILERLKHFPNPDDKEQRPLFNVHAIYEDALTRFGFMAEIIQKLKSVYGSFFLIFLGILSFVQINLVIGRRRKQYGLLAAKGFSWISIQLMVAAQITFSIICASIVSYVLFLIPQWWLHNILKELINHGEYQKRLLISQLELLPWSVLTHIEVTIFVLVVCMLVGVIILYYLRFRHKGQPAYLIA